jgi:excisionase family DNA binding protein
MKTYLTIDDLCLYLKVSKPTIYKWIAKKQIPYIRKNQRVIRFDLQKIDEFMEKHEVLEVS